jgi:hypothetical protein
MKLSHFKSQISDRESPACHPSVTPVPFPCRCVFLCSLCAFALLVVLLFTPPAFAQTKDYLTATEADKIREAEYPALRIKLFSDFAADRLTKFKYELSRGRPDRQRNIRLRSLLEGYMGCLEDATDLVEIGRLRQQDILKGVEALEKRASEMLAELEALEKTTPPDAAYKEELHDAVLSTREALAEVARAKQEIAPPPVRRKP